MYALIRMSKLEDGKFSKYFFTILKYLKSNNFYINSNKLYDTYY